MIMQEQAWEGFRGDQWRRAIDVRDFIQTNYTPYLGDDSFLAGTFSLRPLQKALYPSDQAAPDRRWYLYRIALHPSYQGMGIGRTLIHFACHLADSAQKDLYLDCWAGNHSLRKFYSSAGFDPVGIFSEQDYKICVFSRPFARNP